VSFEQFTFVRGWIEEKRRALEYELHILGLIEKVLDEKSTAPGFYIMPSAAYDHVYGRFDRDKQVLAWFFADETQGEHGPFATEIDAKFALEHYCKESLGT